MRLLRFGGLAADIEGWTRADLLLEKAPSLHTFSHLELLMDHSVNEIRGPRLQGCRSGGHHWVRARPKAIAGHSSGLSQ